MEYLKTNELIFYIRLQFNGMYFEIIHCKIKIKIIIIYFSNILGWQNRLL